MKTIEAKGIVLDIENIDTDQIIPAKYLKSTDRNGFDKGLFANWRYDSTGEPVPDFPLNCAPKDAKVLIAGNNFGCGSSREHAAWALADYGIQAVISSQFADIFKGNALNNSILPIEVSESFLAHTISQVQKHPEANIRIDIETQDLLITEIDFRLSCTFELDPLKKKFILEETNELDYLLSIREEVAAYEEMHVL